MSEQMVVEHDFVRTKTGVAVGDRRIKSAVRPHFVRHRAPSSPYWILLHLFLFDKCSQAARHEIPAPAPGVALQRNHEYKWVRGSLVRW